MSDLGYSWLRALCIKAGKGSLPEYIDARAVLAVIDTLKAENARLREALEWIADAHVPDQPAASAYDDDVWARKWVGTLRLRAKQALNPTEQK